MRYKYIKILGVKINCENRHLILEEIRKGLKSVPKTGVKTAEKDDLLIKIHTPNPEIISFAGKNAWYRELVNTAQINIPDGSGVVWAANFLGLSEIFRITGVEFVQELLVKAQEWGFAVGIIGDKANLAVKLSGCLHSKYPKLEFHFLDSPKFRVSEENLEIVGECDRTSDINKYTTDIISEIKQKNIRILFVGLGFPKQEMYMEKIKVQISRLRQDFGGQAKIKSLVAMGVGGTLDYMAGVVPRAPIWMRKAGMEWLFRLIREPWRIKRQLLGGRFFIDVLRERFGI